jgi:hypothetical protein
MTYHYALMYGRLLLEQNSACEVFEVSLDSRGSMLALAEALVELGCTVDTEERDLSMIVYQSDEPLYEQPLDWAS